MAGLLAKNYKPPVNVSSTQGRSGNSSNKPPKKRETYAASIEQSASDYDEIMRRYKDIIDGGVSPEVTALAAQYKELGRENYDPAQTKYERSPEMGDAIGNLGELSRTGGYDEAGKADLRERGVSPIRAVYKNAMQNITRQKALQGGYSPNYTAAMSKLTRGLSDRVSAGTRDVNAGIAQNVASNRVGIAGQYANTTSNETGMINNVNQQNADRADRAKSFNRGAREFAIGGLGGLYGNQQNTRFNAVEGMRSLYGTTPANPALYGQQALQRASIEQQPSNMTRRRRSGGIASPRSF